MATPSKVFQVSDDDLLLHILNASDDLSSLDDSESDSADRGYLQNADVLDSDTDQASNSAPNNDILQWTVNGQVRSRFSFTGNPGIQVALNDVTDPLEFFELFFDNEIVDQIATETNRYARQFLEERLVNLMARSRSKEWIDTDSNEIRVFLALLLMQGVNHKPDMQCYFSKRTSLYSPFFAEVMDKNRFILLSKFLHFNNNQQYDPNGNIPKKLFKLWPILAHMKAKFSGVYQPERDMAVDESLLLWKGRLGWKQYIPTKRARFGIKSFEVCESSTGYIWDFFLYIGKDTIYNPEIAVDQPMGSKVIYTLVKPLFDKGYCIYMDNFFSSPQLYEVLCQNNTDAVGTLRANRKGVPKELTNKKLKKGEIEAMYCRRLMVLKWKDKKDVHMISTYHDDSTKEVGRHNARKIKPVVCCDYNDTMGGVDLSDCFLSSYPSARKRLKKYYQKQFRHILDMAVLNAYILYKKSGGRQSRLNFILNLVDRVVEKYNHEKARIRKGRRSHTDTPLRLTARHFPSYLPSTPKRKHPGRRCQVCAAKGMRKESIYFCRECDMPLCVVPCFEIYHTVSKY